MCVLFYLDKHIMFLKKYWLNILCHEFRSMMKSITQNFPKVCFLVLAGISPGFGSASHVNFDQALAKVIFSYVTRYSSIN